MLNCMTLYRAGHFFHKHHIPVLPSFFKYAGFLIFNSVIPPSTEIGAQSKCAYGGMGVVVHQRSVIGERVLIGQNTTIGRSLDPEDFPSIGSDVYISAGARIIGKIHVGDNVIIGANAVVTKDVPNNSIVAGVPARVLRTVDCSIWSLLKNVY